jgi:hypothetical protein
MAIRLKTEDTIKKKTKAEISLEIGNWKNTPEQDAFRLWDQLHFNYQDPQRKVHKTIKYFPVEHGQTWANMGKPANW